MILFGFVFIYINGQETDKVRKNIIGVFKDIRFSLEIETNFKEVDFLDAGLLYFVAVFVFFFVCLIVCFTFLLLAFLSFHLFLLLLLFL